MNINTRKIKDTWHYSFRLNGKQTRKAALGAITKEQAKKIAMNDYLKQFENINNPTKHKAEVSGEMLVSDFAKNYFLPFSKANKKTYETDKSMTDNFCEFFKGKALQEIRKLDIEAFRQKRVDTLTQHDKTRRPATVNRELSILSRVFTLAVENEILPYNPCRLVKPLRTNNERIRYLTEDEEKLLLNELKDIPLTKNIVIFAINTGMRQGEIFNLKWFDVDFKREFVQVRESKNGKSRAIPMNEKIISLLKSLSKSSEFVFPSPKTNLRLDNIKRSFNRAKSDVKITDFHFHDLRHTFATRLVDAGVSITVLAELLGHSDIRMTKRYAHATEKAKREAVRVLSKLNRIEQDLSNTVKMQIAISG